MTKTKLIYLILFSIIATKVRVNDSYSLNITHLLFDFPAENVTNPCTRFKITMAY